MTLLYSIFLPSESQWTYTWNIAIQNCIFSMKIVKQDCSKVRNRCAIHLLTFWTEIHTCILCQWQMSQVNRVYRNTGKMSYMLVHLMYVVIYCLWLLVCVAIFCLAICGYLHKWLLLCVGICYLCFFVHVANSCLIICVCRYLLLWCHT